MELKFLKYGFYGTHVIEVCLFYGIHALLVLSSQNSIQTMNTPKTSFLLNLSKGLRIKCQVFFYSTRKTQKLNRIGATGTR